MKEITQVLLSIAVVATIIYIALGLGAPTDAEVQAQLELDIATVNAQAVVDQRSADHNAELELAKEKTRTEQARVEQMKTPYQLEAEANHEVEQSLIRQENTLLEQQKTALEQNRREMEQVIDRQSTSMEEQVMWDIGKSLFLGL